MGKFRYFSLGFLFSLLLNACGGTNVAGIDGTGDGSTVVTAKSTSIGSITDTSDTITVNGVDYDTAKAEITIDDQAMQDPSLLARGQIVIAISDETNNVNNDPLTATEIRYDSNVIGPISAIDTFDPQITVLGQVIRIDSNTVFGNALNFNDLEHAQIVRVSGLLNSDSEITATRIDVLSTTENFQVIGSLQNLDITNMRFTINDLTVDYSNAPSFSFSDGAIIKVKGTQINLEGILQAESVNALTLSLGESGNAVNIEGLITAFNSSTDFGINGIDIVIEDINAVIVENGNLSDLGLDARISVFGELNAQGQLVANRITIINTGPLVFRSTLQGIESDQFYTLNTTDDDIGLWVTLTNIEGTASLQVMNAQNEILCQQDELSQFTANGFCYLDNQGSQEYTVIVTSYSASLDFTLSALFRRAGFAAPQDVLPKQSIRLEQFSGDRNTYRLSTANAASGSFLAVTADGLGDHGQLQVFTGEERLGSLLRSCELSNRVSNNTCWLEIATTSEWFINIESSAETDINVHVEIIQPSIIASGDTVNNTIIQHAGMLYSLSTLETQRSVAGLLTNSNGLITLSANVNRPSLLLNSEIPCIRVTDINQNLQCIMNNQGANQWYFLVKGDLNTQFQLSTLTQTQQNNTQAIALESDFDIDHLEAEITTFTVTTPASNANEIVYVELNDLTNSDFELIVKDNGNIPDQSAPCSVVTTNIAIKRCRLINNSADNQFFITVKSVNAGRYNLSASLRPISNLSENQSVAGQIENTDVGPGDLYRIQNTNDANQVSVDITNKTGPVGLFGKLGAIPNEVNDHDCLGEINNQSPSSACEYDFSQETEIYILIKGDAASEYTLRSQTP
jgi:hypothetical protein